MDIGDDEDDNHFTNHGIADEVADNDDRSDDLMFGEDGEEDFAAVSDRYLIDSA